MIDATTDACVRDAAITLRDFDFEQIVVETAEQRFSLTADTIGNVWTLAAGGARRRSRRRHRPGGGWRLCGVLARRFGLREHDHRAHPRARCSTRTIATTEAGSTRTLASSDARVSRHRQLRRSSRSPAACRWRSPQGEHGQGDGALGFGVAIAVNTIATDTEALVAVERDRCGLTAHDGGLDVEATASGSIQAFTVAGAFAAADRRSSQGSGIGGDGRRLGLRQPDRRRHDRHVRRATSSTRRRRHRSRDERRRRSSPAPARSRSRSPSPATSTAAAVAIGGSFAVNFIAAPTTTRNQRLGRDRLTLERHRRRRDHGRRRDAGEHLRRRHRRRGQRRRLEHRPRARRQRRRLDRHQRDPQRARWRASATQRPDDRRRERRGHRRHGGRRLVDQRHRRRRRAGDCGRARWSRSPPRSACR